MKREKQLVSLSREQNRALLMARSGRRFARTGGRREAERIWEALRSAHRSEMCAHFATDERLIQPFLREVG